MTSQPLRVAVVGGGIGGLATANALLARGVDVTVYEQAVRLGEVGAGVQIAPNGLRVLERMGLGEAVRAGGVQFQVGSQYYRKDGSIVAPSVITDSSGWQGLYGIHRADLLGLLADALPEGVIRTGHRSVGFEQDAHSARVLFENGEVADADVVIGADGIHSVLQRFVVEPSTPVHSGSVAYRGLIPADALPEWSRTTWQMWMGDGKHFLVFPVRSGNVLNYVGFVPSSEQTSESWSAPGDPDRLRSEFVGWDPRVEELLSKVDTTFWWGLYDRNPLPKWTEGRLTLLGDAAHPMLPHLGQGANQSIEDAVTIATLLADATAEDAASRLQTYENLRRERTSRVQLGSRENGARYDSSHDDLDRRDQEIARATGFRWSIYDHDAEEVAKSALLDA